MPGDFGTLWAPCEMRDLEEYFRPRSAREAVELKRQFGNEALYLAGGTDVMVHKPSQIRAVIDIAHTGLDFVHSESDCYVIGGCALLRDVERELDQVAGGMMRAAIRETAPWLIRNAATLAGNLANASPAADSVPALIALDAELELLGDHAEIVPVASILQGPHRTSLGDRLIRSIRITRSAGERIGVFIKHSRSKSDIAQVNLALCLRLDGGIMRDVRIVLGAVAPTAMRAYEAEKSLEGQPFDAVRLPELEEAVRAEVRPISDWRASEEYRRRISGVLARRALEQLIGLDGKDEVA